MTSLRVQDGLWRLSMSWAEQLLWEHYWYVMGVSAQTLDLTESSAQTTDGCRGHQAEVDGRNSLEVVELVQVLVLVPEVLSRCWQTRQ